MVTLDSKVLAIRDAESMHSQHHMKDEDEATRAECCVCVMAGREQQVGGGARGVAGAILLIHTHHWFFLGGWGEGNKRWIFEDGRCCEETLVLCSFFVVCGWIVKIT